MLRRPLNPVPLLLAAASFAATMSSPGRAFAIDPQEQQLAQALFDEGRRLMDKKRYAEACPKLAESQRLDPGGGTVLNLAVCHEKEGKLATAHVDYNEALALATRDGRKDRQQIAREHIAALDAVLPRITIVVAPGSDVEGLEVKLDGFVMRRAAWGVATPVDPGNHVVEATAASRLPWSAKVGIDASQRKIVEVPSLAPGGPPAGAVQIGPPATSAPAAVAAEAPPQPVFVGYHANPLFYGTLAVTVVASGTALVTGYLAFANNLIAKTGCLPDRNFCRDQTSSDAAARATTHAWISTITLGIGVAGAVALLFVPQRLPNTTAPTVGAAPLPGGGVVDVSGRF